MLSLAASHILKRAGAHGGIIQHYTSSLLHYNVSEIPPYMCGTRFPSPCIIKGDQLRPDMLLSVGKTTLYMSELSYQLK